MWFAATFVAGLGEELRRRALDLEYRLPEHLASADETTMPSDDATLEEDVSNDHEAVQPDEASVAAAANHGRSSRQSSRVKFSSTIDCWQFDASASDKGTLVKQGVNFASGTRSR